MSIRMKWVLLLWMVSGGVWATPPVLLVYGDSLSAAYGIPREAGWVALLEKRLPDWRVVNASVSGETTAGGLTRLSGILAAHKPRLVILELGANDGLRGLPLARTEANLNAMVQQIRAQGGETLLVGMRLPPNYGPAYTQGFQALFAQVARKQRAALVTFLLEGVADRIENFQADGLHPTAEAQPRILENVWTVLVPRLLRAPR